MVTDVSGMSNFERVNYWYTNEYYDIDKVWNLVGKCLEEEEYNEITGFTYPSKG